MMRAFDPYAMIIEKDDSILSELVDHWWGALAESIVVLLGGMIGVRGLVPEEYCKSTRL